MAEQWIAKVGQGALQSEQDVSMAAQGVSKSEQGISMVGQDIPKVRFHPFPVWHKSFQAEACHTHG